ncbi:hypothetical protein L6452_28005 [Arctium lappa]|uniref:Uncharacterized protein n=1 Tax=Arctium lappa TaxID=4217 RepID=A0ACB8ZWP2_ARCLA|nr:hypothetical protein L6452_28005 [Arctium lappa]
MLPPVPKANKWINRQRECRSIEIGPEEQIGEGENQKTEIESPTHHSSSLYSTWQDQNFIRNSVQPFFNLQSVCSLSFFLPQ